MHHNMYNIYTPTWLQDQGVIVISVVMYRLIFLHQLLQWLFVSFSFFIKLFISILLILITMFSIPAPNIKLDKPGLDSIYSMAFCWKEHGEINFGGLMEKFNNNYKQFMLVDIFKALYSDESTCTHIKVDTYDTVNEWYSTEVVNQSIHTVESLEAFFAFEIVQKVPFHFMYKDEGEDYDSKKLAEFLHYFWSKKRNIKHKNWEKFYLGKTKQYEILFKDTLYLFPLIMRYQWAWLDENQFWSIWRISVTLNAGRLWWYCSFCYRI